MYRNIVSGIARVFHDRVPQGFTLAECGQCLERIISSGRESSLLCLAGELGSGRGGLLRAMFRCASVLGDET